MNKFLAIVLILILISCKNEPNKGFTTLAGKDICIDFTNKVEKTLQFNIFSYCNFYNGGGVGIGDINNDGLQDVFLTSNMGENKLYLNLGEFQFKDVTTSYGLSGTVRWSTGVTFVDINADGFLDIYVCNAGFMDGTDQKNELWINQGSQSFVESAASYGLDENGYTTHAAFFDYDRDLDIYLLNNSFITVYTFNYANNRLLRAKDRPVKDFLKGGGDKLLRNDNGKFIDVSEAAGIYGSLIGFGLGVSVSDVNGDHYLDIYVSNDFYEKDYLYMNNQDGTFSDQLEDRIDQISMSSMGSDIGDLNNDGAPEIFTTDMLPSDDTRLKTITTFDNYDTNLLKVQSGFYHQYMKNALHLNDGQGNFSEIANFAGVSATDWSWGALMFDYDNDGLLDIFVSNGIYKDVINQDFIDFFADELIQKMVMTGKKEEVASIVEKMPSVPIRNCLFNNRGSMQFEEVAGKVGMNEPTFSNGSAYGDLDNDGDLDLIFNNVNQPVSIFRNEIGGNSLTISLIGSNTSKNTFAVGAKVSVFIKDTMMSKELYSRTRISDLCRL